MSEETVDCCPRCESTKVRVYANGKFKDAADTGPRYGCDGCGARFETPDERERLSSAHGRSGASKRLLDADPDEVGP